VIKEYDLVSKAFGLDINLTDDEEVKETNIPNI